MADNQEANQSGGGKGLIIVLVVLVVLLLVAVGVGGYMLYSSGVLSGQQQNNQEQVQDSQKANPGEMFKASINDLVLNITNAKGREKLMKLSFSVKSTEPTIESIVEEYKPEIVDAVIAQVSSRSSEELLTVGGKALLKEELLDEINSILNEVTSNSDIQKDCVKQILFTSFVIK
ncbi:flagellar basal body-associated FliL family protein [Halarcobacter anaerophilus]|jgi:flagellar FliL protein|uniref:Flagellar protein FliL n=1 Tax=Halarcobacter anaerophilus TaxID=877500 RepID=A0A4Q0Y0N8_9BACT|nr:flagellar basal body-associated FliL family protein [Halarcobacter anaerophilus]QDF30119.1 flagellar motor-associated protein FliL [Halarcobacter anaerophilus]RXJ63163.1 flagellar basal body protein FliL [Halarcobacter anaerophilus]